jgi:hypothetical protein
MMGAGSKAQMERAGGFVDGEETELKAVDARMGQSLEVEGGEARTRRGKERRGKELVASRSNRRIKAEVGPKYALSPFCLFAFLPEPFSAHCLTLGCSTLSMPIIAEIRSVFGKF